MKCPYCQGELKPGAATYTSTRGGCDIVFHDLPAWVCAQCGEPLFGEEAVDAIQEVLLLVDARIEPLRRQVAA